MNIGIDIGSREVKIYCANKKPPPVTKKYSTIEFYKTFGSTQGSRLTIDRRKVEDEIGISLTDSHITATGYGRNNLNMEGVAVIPEIQAHTSGAIIQTGLNNFTLLDIGGQDIKVISVSSGIMQDFVMNDKCAAGTGRYLENIAHILEIPVEELGTYTETPVELSHTCAIFGESEIVTGIAEGFSIPMLCAGANLSVARRIIPLIKKFKHNTIVITGGVGKNKGVCYFISQEIDAEIVTPVLPQFNGAIGCAKKVTFP